MATETTQVKSLVGKVVSVGMTNTVSVEVTTAKVHPLYHKRYRWTTKYLSDTSKVSPNLGDTVKIVASRPISRHKRWVVAEVLTEANQAQRAAVKKAGTTNAAKPSRKGKKS
jgi:small subunit ribosomal protein S17